MKVSIKINNIPFDEQILSRDILKYADSYVNVDELTDEQLEEFAERILPDIENFTVELSAALAEYVGEKYGEELRNAFRGVPDNAEGIWFEDVDVDYDTYDEIRSKCIDLANNPEWLNENVVECIIDYIF